MVEGLDIGMVLDDLLILAVMTVILLAVAMRNFKIRLS